MSDNPHINSCSNVCTNGYTHINYCSNTCTNGYTHINYCSNTCTNGYIYTDPHGYTYSCPRPLRPGDRCNHRPGHSGSKNRGRAGWIRQTGYEGMGLLSYYSF